MDNNLSIFKILSLNKYKQMIMNIKNKNNQNLIFNVKTWLLLKILIYLNNNNNNHLKAFTL